jgi:hypothetical protein
LKRGVKMRSVLECAQAYREGPCVIDANV